MANKYVASLNKHYPDLKASHSYDFQRLQDNIQKSLTSLQNISILNASNDEVSWSSEDSTLTTPKINVDAVLSDYIDFNSSLSFRKNESIKVKLDSTGNLNVGTTTNSGNKRLNVYVNGLDGYAGYFFADGNSPNNVGLGIQCGSDDPVGLNPSQIFIVCLEGDASITGYIAASNTGLLALTNVSDERLKTNIEPTKINALETLNSLELIEYNRYKGDYLYNKTNCGFSAQNCRLVYPEMVSDFSGFLGINQTALIPVLVKAVQELSEQLRNLTK